MARREDPRPRHPRPRRSESDPCPTPEDRRRIRRAAHRHVSARAARRQHTDQSGPRVRSFHSLQPRTSTRRSSSSRGCRASLAGVLVGAALAAAGVVFQALLRNPLATPFTLGVSAGASLGAMLAIVLGATSAAGPLSAVPLASLAGAAIAAAIVYRLATMQDRAMSTTVLLLAGVTLNSFFSALILFVQYIADFAQVYRAARWLMGDLDVGSFRTDRGRAAAAGDRVRDVRVAAVVAESAQCRRRCGGRVEASMSGERSGSHSSARHSPLRLPCRSPARSVSSASSCRTSCG